MVGRNFNVVDILNAVKSKFIRASSDLISKYISKWSTAYGKQQTIVTAAPLKEKTEALLRRKGVSKNIQRVSVYTSRYSPKQDSYVEDGWYVDVPRFGSQKQLKEYALQALMARMATQYPGAIATQADFIKFVQSVEINTEEWEHD